MKFVTSILVAIFISISPAYSFFGKNKELDNKRVSLLKGFVSQIEEYKAIKGYYPLGNGDFEMPAVVYLNKSIKEVDYPIHYKNVTVYDYEILVAELKKVLGNKFMEFDDPVEGYKKPSKYISKYYLGGNTFLLTANMSSAVKESYHNTFIAPTERQYINESKVEKFTFYPGFMHRFSFATITNAHFNIFSPADYTLLEQQDFRIKKKPKKLYRAIMDGDYGNVEKLIAKGVDINPFHGSFNEVSSPLIFAVRNNDIKMAKILIEAGADVNARGSYQDPVLIYGMNQDKIDYDLIELLLSQGADVNTPNFFGISPFIGACKTGDQRLVDLFIKHGAKMDVFFFYNQEGEFKKGHTPIEAAIDAGQLEVIKVLIENGVDVHAKSKSSGLTPLGFAQKKQKEDAYVLMASMKNE